MALRLSTLTLIAALVLGGCAVTPEVEHDLAAPVQFRALAGAPAVLDGRAGFRRAFCAALRAEGLASPDDASCDRWFWRLADEPIEWMTDKPCRWQIRSGSRCCS